MFKIAMTIVPVFKPKQKQPVSRVGIVQPIVAFYSLSEKQTSSPSAREAATTVIQQQQNKPSLKDFETLLTLS